VEPGGSLAVTGNENFHAMRILTAGGRPD